ncbi:MAG: rRNA maturation RNase YbeY [Gammaproteobacteria bacterium]|nr:MAG: rRNA maturation RNase YbeY [Gammaproteobacteria bacterium]
MKVQLNVQNVSTSGHVPETVQLLQWAEAALSEIDENTVELGVRIVDENESAELNSRYRKKQGPTNVLSFSYEDPPGASSNILGDLVICAPIVQDEAREQNKNPDAHWAHMVVHGIMHLRGYDHEQDDDAEIMQNKEAQLLKTLGYPNPYV